MDLVDPDLAQPLRHEGRGLEEVEVELGDGVQVPPPGAHLGLELRDPVDHRHALASCPAPAPIRPAPGGASIGVAGGLGVRAPSR